MKRELDELFEAKLRKLWNDLEIRALVLVSLFLQIFLTASGNRRKYIRKKWVSVIIWLSYLSADAVATIALGVLSRAESNDGKSNSLGPSYTIMAFWAPFLLMHLGGPDTITAYALADNELWARHLLGLLTQVGFAIYILFRSWNGGTPLNLLWMVVFFAGLIKYGERTWVLFSVSKDRFRESFIRPDPGPNYVRFMAKVVSREREGYIRSLDQTAKETIPSSSPTSTPDIESAAVEFELLQVAYSLFGTFKQLFADLIVGPEDGERSLSLFMQMDWYNAFSVVEVELGLVYELFYTKAFILYSLGGFFLRFLSISTTIAAFVSFAMIDKNVYPKTEVMITYTLLGGAISLEIYAIMLLLSSERIVIWLSGDTMNLPEYMSKVSVPIFRIVSVLRYLGTVPARARWSNAMGQYNALDYFLEGQSRCSNVHFYLEKYLFWKCATVPDRLKALIFYELRYRDRRIDKNKLDRGDQILLKEMNCEIVGDGKNHEVPFDQSILLWHMATDLCYQTDKAEEEVKPDESSSVENLNFKREICNLLSNYMMHLFMMSPLMLPSGIGQVRFLDTRAQAMQFFGKQKLSKLAACQKLLEVNTPLPPNLVEGNKSKSVFFDACRLAKNLRLPEFRDRKWEIITQAWLDILIFAAAQCQWNYHAEKLSQGGELLTHVWLLISHLGMTDQVLTEEEYPSGAEVYQA